MRDQGREEVADQPTGRYRWVVLGLGIAAVDGSLFLAAMLFLAGVLGAVTNVASGRVVMGWFDFAERGTAFGLRQAAVPLGGALAALTLPALVAATTPRAGPLVLGVGCALAAAACAVGLRDPASPTTPGWGSFRDRRGFPPRGGGAGPPGPP